MYGQVRAAVSALKHYRSLPKLPSDFSIPETSSPDLMDFLHYVFGFQVCTAMMKWITLCFLYVFKIRETSGISKFKSLSLLSCLSLVSCGS